MQFCQDGDLYKKIRNTKKKFPEKKIKNWMAQLIASIHYLHSKKILHRDLKTQNIFLNKKRLILGDFGISKTLENTKELANTYIGTPYYMSPELFNYKPYSYKSDIWSLGCVLYEICNLKHAFNAQTINGLAMKILKGNYVPVCKFYSKGLREFIESLLVTDARLRPGILKITEMGFVKRILGRYFVELVLENELCFFEVEAIKGQVLKIGLSFVIKEEIRDLGEVQRKRVFDVLLSKRDLGLVKKELESYKEMKEVELEREKERKKKLEGEMERLKLKKESLGFKSNFESENVFKKKKWDLEIEEECYREDCVDFDDYEFYEDGDEIQILEEILNTKISVFNGKLTNNTLLIKKIKKEISETIDKINNPEKELIGEENKDLDYLREDEDNKNYSEKKEPNTIQNSENNQNLTLNQLKQSEDLKLEYSKKKNSNNSQIQKCNYSDNKEINNDSENKEIHNDSENIEINNYSENKEILNYSESKKSNLSTSNILKTSNEYFYSTNEFEDSKLNFEEENKGNEDFEDFKIVNVLKEKIKDLKNKICNGLGKNLNDQIFKILDFEIVKKIDFEMNKILDIIGKENIGYCHLIEQYVYFSQELMELKNNDN